MCLSRGDCANLFDNHGDPRNFTMQAMLDASNAAGITVPETLRNIQRGVSASLRDMTDWTGDQAGTLLSSALPPPSPGEVSPGS